MSAEILFIVLLHLIAAVISLISALRRGFGLLSALRWGGLGFITGILGLITHRRVGRRHLHYMMIVQDAILNLGMELLAIYGIPFMLKS